MKRGFVLLLMAILTLGCVKQSPDPAQLLADESALIQATVTDPARAERLLALLEQRDRLIEESTALLRQYQREMKAVNADYDASREIIIEMIDSYNHARAQKLLRFIELITQMKAATSAAEWKVIAEFQLEYFIPRQLIYGRARETPGMPNAMLSVFLLGGGLLGGAMVTPDDADLISKRIKLVVEDSARVEEAMRLLDELETEIEEFDRIFIDSGESLRDLYLDHGAGSRQTQSVLEPLNLEWYTSQNRNVKLRARLKESITADEWAKIFGAE